MRILIAEDDLVSRRLLQKTLEEWGHEILTVENGHEAWEIFRKEGLKFIIADWIMPVMDGLALCQKIRSSGLTGYVYFILLTGKEKKEDIIKGLEAGADDYVVKPFDREELKVRIRAGERILNLEKELMEKNDELKRLNLRLEDLACLDPLMDIGNRRGFHLVIEKIHYRACRYEQGYGIIMCDIDNFKSYNDTYGHLSGDAILRKTADSIKQSLRISDDIFRYGGEEIVVILPNQSLEGSVIAAERIRKGVESLGIEHKGSNRGILTLSCGVSAYEQDCKENIRWEAVLDRADKALYLAKSSGKNKVCSYSKKSE